MMPPAADADIEAAWRLEVAARVSARDAGEVEMIPWEGIREGLLVRLREEPAD